jgi:hypothetical protein
MRRLPELNGRELYTHCQRMHQKVQGGSRQVVCRPGLGFMRLKQLAFMFRPFCGCSLQQASPTKQDFFSALQGFGAQAAEIRSCKEFCGKQPNFGLPGVFCSRAEFRFGWSS